MGILIVKYQTYEGQIKEVSITYESAFGIWLSFMARQRDYLEGVINRICS